MRWFSVLTFLVCLALCTPTNATTYTYEGQPLTETVYTCCTCLPCTLTFSPISGSVSFANDTSSFTGMLALSSGDTATFQVPFIVPPSSLNVPLTFDYPGNNPPEGTFGWATTLTSDFTFVNGAITAWSVDGGIFLQDCGGGPGCAASGRGFSISSESGDSSDQGNLFGTVDSATNPTAGTWEGGFIAAPVPEPSTWAMLLIGIAGITFTAYRRKQNGPALRIV